VQQKSLFQKGLSGSTTDTGNGVSLNAGFGKTSFNIDCIGVVVNGIFNDRTLTSIFTSSEMYSIGS